MLDVIVEAARAGKIKRGRLFFGFLTGSGMDALMAVPEVEETFVAATLHVLVGLDAVTDRAGLYRLRDLAERNPELTVRVIKNTTGALVHPKMFVFEYDDGSGVAVVGSNNLSANGLSGNVEGYSIYRYGPDEAPDLTDWNDFLTRWTPLLSPIDDEAIERAKRNERRAARLKRAGRIRTAPGVPAPEVVIADGQVMEATPSDGDVNELMLAIQLPASDRWSQVQISKPISRDFFGFDPGVSEPPVLILREHNRPEPERQRKMLYLPKSDTVRFEVAAAKRAGDYPEAGRPIALLRRESADEPRYRYVFLMPGDAGHTDLEDLTNTEFEGRGLPRVIVPRSRVMAAWPDCPL